ncbi:asparagine synthase (glutamine-hydrolyzing) [Algivirga pacifica]|uniref:asparagine synthase (glutamine-hydrolyzing) n=1 Tax=Algivirga pacifica TaxID=1162670 RepID=A0ABP9DNM9_9BACT
MCGITGAFAFNEIGRLYQIGVHESNNRMAHRGPDAGNLYNSQFVSLGHRRLSIIDLSNAANQPMQDSTGRYRIVFNGEIYNFQELRQQLEKKGVLFQTQSDTEVLLEMYIHYGKACLSQLHGFFAFAIYDEKEESLFIGRDRMGIKPLVYYYDEDKFLFASEMNALLAHNIPKNINYSALHLYFQLSYIPAPHTIYEGIHKLMPGHYMEVRKKEVSIEPYYTLEDTSEKSIISSYEDAQQKLLTLLESSVQERLISDVPLGAFLSGGIDSSGIVAMASRHTQHLNTFSIGYQDEPHFDETHYAQLVAKKYQTNHTVFQLGKEDLSAHLFDLMDHFGEPFADSSALPLYILCKETRKHATVALSGDGGDELFAGYNKYQGAFRARYPQMIEKAVQFSAPFLKLLPQNRNNALGNTVRQLRKFAKSMSLTPQEQYWFLSSWRSEIDSLNLFQTNIQEKIQNGTYQKDKQEYTKAIHGKGINDILAADIKLLLPNDMLYKVDSMSMANSLEVRVPFLDHQLAEFAFSLPTSYKVDRHMKKRILQDALRPYLPEEIYNRPKKGFEVPLMGSYKTTLKSWVEQLLDDTFVKEQGIFNPSVIRSIREQVFKSNNYDQNQVWALLIFQHWWKKQ